MSHLVRRQGLAIHAHACNCGPRGGGAGSSVHRGNRSPIAGKPSGLLTKLGGMADYVKAESQLADARRLRRLRRLRRFAANGTRGRTARRGRVYRA
jgi:hypothetical protein